MIRENRRQKVPVCCWEWAHVCNASPGGPGAAVWRVTYGASEAEAELVRLPQRNQVWFIWCVGYNTKGRDYGAMYGGGTWLKYHHLVGGGGRISTSKPTWLLHKYYTHKHAFTCYIHVTRWYGLSVSKCANPTCSTAVDCDHVKMRWFRERTDYKQYKCRTLVAVFRVVYSEESTGFVNPGVPREACEDGHALVCLQFPTIYIAHHVWHNVWQNGLLTSTPTCIHFPHLHTHSSHTVKKLFWILPNQPPFSKRCN